MKLGVDVDGVLVNTHDFEYKKGLEMFGSERLLDPNASGLTKMFDINEEEESKFWGRYIWEYCRKTKPNPYVVEIMNKVKEQGNSIHIITSRVHTTRNDAMGMLFRSMLKTWLKDYNIPYDSIHYCNGENSDIEKTQICEKLGIDCMIDDTIENCEAVERVCKSFCNTTVENKDYVFGDVTRVNNFLELYDKISLMPQFSHEESPYCTDKIRSRYKLSRNFMGPLFMKAYKPIVIGEELIPQNRRLIFAGNHLHVNDQYPVLCMVDGVVHCLGKVEYNKGLFGNFCRNTGIIFVDRDTKEGRAKSFEDAVSCLRNGDSLCLFPEGTRNQYTNVLIKIEEIENMLYWIDRHYNGGNISFGDYFILREHLEKQLDVARGNLDYAKRIVESHNISVDEDELLLPFKTGAVRMAMETDSMIVPFAINGNYKIGGDNLMLRFGEPFKPSGNPIGETELLRNKIGLLEMANLDNISDDVRFYNPRFVKNRARKLMVKSYDNN